MDALWITHVNGLYGSGPHAGSGVVPMGVVTWTLFKFLRAVFRRAQSLFSSAIA